MAGVTVFKVSNILGGSHHFSRTIKKWLKELQNKKKLHCSQNIFQKGTQLIFLSTLNIYTSVFKPLFWQKYKEPMKLLLIFSCCLINLYWQWWTIVQRLKFIEKTRVRCIDKKLLVKYSAMTDTTSR